MINNTTTNTMTDNTRLVTGKEREDYIAKHFNPQPVNPPELIEVTVKERLTGQRLLDYVHGNQLASRSEQCSGAGYVKVLKDGSIGNSYTDFYEAILEARNINGEYDPIEEEEEEPTSVEILGHDLEIEQLVDIVNHGMSAGVSGFIYSTELADTYDQYENEIWELLDSVADDAGDASGMDFVIKCYTKNDDEAYYCLQNIKEHSVWMFVEMQAYEYLFSIKHNSVY